MENNNRMLITYHGRRTYDNGKSIYHKYSKENGEVLTFGTKIKTPHVVGSIVEVTETDKGVQSPYILKGTDKDRDNISEWHAKDVATADDNAAFKLNTKKLPNDYDDAITALRFCYGKMSYFQRQAFINRVIVEITK